MELYEFYHFTHEGAGPTASGFWSAFYALVGTHGLHVFAGLACLSLFWHFLDVIWICVFSIVYLMGVM